MISLRYFIKRTIITIILLWLVLSILFLMVKSLPGSYLDILRNRGVPPEVISSLAAQWHLDEPLHIQYIMFLKSVLQGQWGVSFRFQTPVMQLVSLRMFQTFILVGPGIIAAYVLGSIYGVLAGSNSGSYLDRYGIIPLIMVGSVPTFVSSIFLIVIFAGIFDIFPTGGMIGIQTELALEGQPWWRKYLTQDFFWHYPLPFLAVVFRYLFIPSMVMRNSIGEVVEEGFVYFNRMTGIPRRNQLYHIARHASLPVITIFPVSFTRAFGGLVLIETVFNWPGIGKLLVDSVIARDFPVVVFVFFFIATFIILANFFVDILYGVIDPRVSATE